MVLKRVWWLSEGANVLADDSQVEISARQRDCLSDSFNKYFKGCKLSKSMNKHILL